MSLLAVFQWLSQSPVGLFMQQSTYAFAVVEMAHLVSLTLLCGAILLVDLRVLGWGLKRRPARDFAKDLQNLIVTSLLVAVISGVLLLSEEALKCYYNPAFRAKMLFLLLAVWLYFFVQSRLFRFKDGTHTLVSKSAGAISLLLWFGVGLCGRAIGFI